MDKTKIIIFGSCVSRDALEYDYNKDFELVGYFARSSFASLQSVPNVKQSLLKKIESKFQKNVVEFDMKKSFWDFVGTVSFDLLLIDLIDERFDLLEFPNGAIHTLSNEYLNHLDQPIEGRKISSRSSEHFELWKKGINKLIDVLHKQNALSKLRISEVYYAEFDSEGKPIDGYDKKLIALANKFLQQCYAFLKEIIPEKSFIWYPKITLISDSNNKWGIAPFYFIKKFYLNTLDFLNGIYKEKDQIEISIELTTTDKIETQIKHVQRNNKCLYAFYLFKDNERINISNYNSNSKSIFELNGSGTYKVMGFIKYEEHISPEIIYSNELEIKKDIPLYDLSKWEYNNFRYMSIEDFFEKFNLQEGIHSIILNNENLSLDLLLISNGVNLIEENKFLVCFNAAEPNRHLKSAPFFSGINISKTIKKPLLSIADSTLSLSKEITTAWYAGNRYCPNQIKIIADVLNFIADKFCKNYTIFGGSSGGFASLAILNFLKKSASVFVWNPQIKIENYVDIHVQKYLSCAYDENVLKGNFYEFMEQKQIFHDVSKNNNYNFHHIIYAQNVHDWHLEKHTKYIVNCKHFETIDNNKYIDNKTGIVYLFGDWGSGHVAPDKETINNIIRSLIDGISPIIVAKIVQLNCTKSPLCLLEEQDKNSLTLNHISRLKQKYKSIISGGYDALLEVGFKSRRDAVPVKLSIPMTWHSSDRNVEANLHMWRFLNPIWGKFFEINDESLFHEICNYISDWAFYSKTAKSKFIWGDMPTGIRCIHLSLIYELYSLGYLSNLSKNILTDLINTHIEKLLNPQFISKGNHALYQIIGLRILSETIDRGNSIYQYCEQHLSNLISEGFDDNYVNTENSPFYHQYNISIFSTINSFLFPSLQKKLAAIIKNGSVITGWLTAPDGNFYRIGDTEGEGKKLNLSLDDSYYTFSEGKIIIKDLSSSGYIIVRTIPEIIKNESESLIFHATDKSKEHSHSDHLSFMLYYKGIEIFADPGKYTYNLDSAREYFSGDRSHNTLGIANKNFLPKDSALGNSSLNFSSEGKYETIQMSGKEIKGDILIHTRYIDYSPSNFIIIKDEITDYSLEDNIEIRFLFGTEIDVYILDEQTIKIYANSINIADMKLQTGYIKISLEKGTEQNGMRGWISKSYHTKESAFSLMIEYSPKIKSIETKIFFLNNNYSENIIFDLKNLKSISYKEFLSPKSVKTSFWKKNIQLYKRVQKLIDFFKIDLTFTNLVNQAMQNNYITVPSIYSDIDAICCRSFYAHRNCLLFNDNGKIFFIVQFNYLCYGIYLPSKNLFISQDGHQSTHLEILETLNKLSIKNKINYQENFEQGIFAGITNGCSRPYHYIYDRLTILYDHIVSCKSQEPIPILTKKTEGFLSAANLLGSSIREFFVDEYNDVLLKNNAFCIESSSSTHPLQRNRGKLNLFDFLHSKYKPNTHISKKYEKFSTFLYNSDFVLWLGMGGEKRVWLEQEEGFILILQELQLHYKNIVVLLDGITSPYFKEIEKYNDLIGEEKKSLLLKKFENINFIDMNTYTMDDKLILAHHADFYFSNALTDSMIISALAKKPGIAYAAVAANVSIHNHPLTFFIPKDLIKDLPSGRGSWATIDVSMDPHYILNIFKNALSFIKQKKIINMFTTIPKEIKFNKIDIAKTSIYQFSLSSNYLGSNYSIQIFEKMLEITDGTKEYILLTDLSYDMEMEVKISVEIYDSNFKLISISYVDLNQQSNIKIIEMARYLNLNLVIKGAGTCQFNDLHLQNIFFDKGVCDSINLDFEYDLKTTGSDTLICFLPSRRTKDIYPYYPRKKWRTSLDLDTLYLSDPFQNDNEYTEAGGSWFIDKTGKSILPNIAETINEFVNKKKYTKVIFYGSSMGGYAAIVLGSMIKNAVIIAEAPQIYLEQYKYSKIVINKFCMKDTIHTLPNIEKILFETQNFETHIIVNIHDEHYTTQILPFMKKIIESHLQIQSPPSS